MARYRAARNTWKMILVFLGICGALLLIRWAAMIWA
ncbi:small membrane protein YniD [Pantoea osteomyelitidis]|uniref:Small membrane protein YniD n=1 Tax=Pantoea osteomyelitidis TaxID=3230026 RepID=A0ABW7PTH6_9GAMM